MLMFVCIIPAWKKLVGIFPSLFFLWTNFHFYFLAGFFIQWQNKWIQVFRPDVECTNGIIHVIDRPFLVESDIYVTGGGVALKGHSVNSIVNVVLANSIMLIVTKLLFI